VQLEQTQNDVEKLRGTMEEHLHRIEQVEAQAASFKSELEQKIAALDELQKKQAEAAAAREKDREKQQAAAAAAKKEDETPEDKQGLYDDARKKLDEGAAGDARKGFQAFLKKWPKDALAANAQYWLGETYYADGKYQEAIVEFQKVREQHPKSEKAADALLKLGYSFAQLNMSKEASLFLDEVIQKHPATPAARLAKDKLKQLKDGKK
jgi:tol-pal system protein YbgF